MKPWTVLSNLHDRELLAQIEAVDAFMDRMHAYPGRTFGQLYHRFFRTNDLADGRLALEDRTLDLARREAPGARGRRAAATGSRRSRPATTSRRCSRTRKVELATAPGGHLGVLTGRAAAGTTWKLLDGFLDEPPATRRAKRAKPRADAA